MLGREEKVESREDEGRPGAGGCRAEADAACLTTGPSCLLLFFTTSQHSPEPGWDREGPRGPGRDSTTTTAQNDKYRLLELHEWAQPQARCHPQGQQR